jgi:hypothetical protein
MRTVALGSTFYFTFTTRAFATGVPTALAGTPDLSVIEENNATPIDTGATVTTGHASVTGLNLGTVVATTGNGYEAGKVYQVYIDTGTVGGVSVVGEVVYEFQIETAAQKGTRLLSEIHANHVVGATGNTTTKAHLENIELGDNDSLIGELIMLYDVDQSERHLVICTDWVEATELATVKNIYTGAALPHAPASGDYYWRVGAGNVNAQFVNQQLISGDGGSGTEFQGA